MSKLSPVTTDVIRELINVDWFRCVGVDDVEKPRVVRSWKEAVEWASSAEWENLRLDATNTYRTRLLERDPQRFKQWNDIVRKVKPFSEGLVEDKARLTIVRNKLPVKIEHVIQWDILFLLVECEYSDVCPLGWSGSQAYWYKVGHFPCGWEGEYPGGRRVVY